MSGAPARLVVWAKTWATRRYCPGHFSKSVRSGAPPFIRGRGFEEVAHPPTHPAKFHRSREHPQFGCI
jgi:hypothetical protein